jgi:hypothetical protein
MDREDASYRAKVQALRDETNQRKQTSDRVCERIRKQLLPAAFAARYTCSCLLSGYDATPEVMRVQGASDTKLYLHSTVQGSPP